MKSLMTPPPTPSPFPPGCVQVVTTPFISIKCRLGSLGSLGSGRRGCRLGALRLNAVQEVQKSPFTGPEAGKLHALGWRAEIAWETGVRAAVRWYSEHRDWLDAAIDRGREFREKWYRDR